MVAKVARPRFRGQFNSAERQGLSTECLICKRLVAALRKKSHTRIMQSPTAAVPDQFERPSLSSRIVAGFVIGICLTFLLPPEADWDSSFDLQTVVELIGAAAVFCAL